MEETEIMPELFDKHFQMMELLSPTEYRRIQNDEARTIVIELSILKMVEFDGDRAKLLPDGISSLEDYRELQAIVPKKLGL